MPTDIALWSYADRVLRRIGPDALRAWFDDLTAQEQGSLFAQGDEVLAFLRNVATDDRRDAPGDGPPSAPPPTLGG